MDVNWSAIEKIIIIIGILFLCGLCVFIIYISFTPFPADEAVITGYFEDVNNSDRDQIINRICSDKRENLSDMVDTVLNAGRPQSYWIWHVSNNAIEKGGSYFTPVVYTYNLVVTATNNPSFRRYENLDLRCSIFGCCLEDIVLGLSY